MRASDALSKWRHFELGWASVVPHGSPLQTDTTVAVQASHVWFLVAERVPHCLYDKRGWTSETIWFCLRDLPDHAERGEERFMIECLEDNSVWYDIYASRPQKARRKTGFAADAPAAKDDSAVSRWRQWPRQLAKER